MPFRVESKSVAALAKQLARTSSNLPRDLRRTMVSAQRGAKTEATRAARKVYNVKAQTLGPLWQVTNVDPVALAFTLIGLKKPIGLFGFVGTRETARGIVADPMKGGSRGVIARSFGATINGARNPFQRRGKSRLPIRRLTGPSPADILSNVAVTRDLTTQFLARTERELSRLIRNALSGKS